MPKKINKNKTKTKQRAENQTIETFKDLSLYRKVHLVDMLFSSMAMTKIDKHTSMLFKHDKLNFCEGKAIRCFAMNSFLVLHNNCARFVF